MIASSDVFVTARIGTNTPTTVSIGIDSNCSHIWHKISNYSLIDGCLLLLHSFPEELPLLRCLDYSRMCPLSRSRSQPQFNKVENKMESNSSLHMNYSFI